MNDRTEGIRQAGHRQSVLSGLGMDVELPTLGARGRRGIRLVDRRGDAVKSEDVSQNEATEASTDNRDRYRHDAPRNTIGTTFHRRQVGTTFQVCQEGPMQANSKRRADTLSRERIIAVAIEILDADGENALTFRALAARLKTGSGALYWHIADKNELLAAAADRIIAQMMAALDPGIDPHGAIRAIALGVFDAIDAHPWVGTQLIREPWQPGTLRIFEGIGRGLVALGVPEPAQFDAWSALVNYMLGVAGQNAVNARLLREGSNRLAFLEAVATRWEQLDPADFQFVRGLAKQLRDHDDREQFLAGIDLILSGLATT